MQRSVEGPGSPETRRNPSPPPDRDEAEAEADGADRVGSSVYSRRWLFGTLSRLIQTVTEQNSSGVKDSTELSEELEEELCKVWDMAMDKVANLAADSLTDGLTAPKRMSVFLLQEICVGILGNMACFHDNCVALSEDADLGAVALLLLGDTDPATLLATCRLLLTFVSQPEVAGLWLERIQQQPSVCSYLCFIMSSSTNVELLLKVGELVYKVFDEDDELMKDWTSAQCRRSDHNSPDLTSSVVEAAKQIRNECPEGLKIYLHIIQLLTTVEEGLQALVRLDGPAKSLWSFVCELFCEHWCQPDDPPLILLEQKDHLCPALAVLSALHANQAPHHVQISLDFVASLSRLLHYHSECQLHETEKGTDEEDMQLKAVVDFTVALLAGIIMDLPTVRLVLI
uniref:Uncharacterized protein n=1 Tax=Denticeps clupeoides TaxID=299321 RepID=A0AAY4E1H6_9TELE